jgi:hypothetical protein
MVKPSLQGYSHANYNVVNTRKATFIITRVYIVAHLLNFYIHVAISLLASNVIMVVSILFDLWKVKDDAS